MKFNWGANQQNIFENTAVIFFRINNYTQVIEI